MLNQINLNTKVIFCFFVINILDNKVPGPQKYASKSLINGTGMIFNSKFVSSPGKTISGKFKLAESKLKSKEIYLIFLAPGPGSYKIFSEFGIYKSKYADDNANTQKAEIKEEEK